MRAGSCLQPMTLIMQRKNDKAIYMPATIEHCNPTFQLKEGKFENKGGCDKFIMQSSYKLNIIVYHS